MQNLKLVRRLFGRWLSRLPADRLVKPDRSGNQPLASVPLSATGTIVHLKGFGFIKVFKIVVT
ncbi:MAG: IS701 family transposase, partial [Anaerolineae bacterium]|nr:IS701 family transposase [Anaerolineae bacterium]